MTKTNHIYHHYLIVANILIPESVMTIIRTVPGFTYVPGDDGFYHVLFMNIVDVG